MEAAWTKLKGSTGVLWVDLRYILEIELLGFADKVQGKERNQVNCLVGGIRKEIFVGVKSLGTENRDEIEEKS